MALGPGKYDDIAEHLLRSLDADVVMLAILGGPAGNGFSLNTVSPSVARQLPAVLREIANQLENDLVAAAIAAIGETS